MDIRFLPHNTHLEGILNFSERDPQLRQIKTQQYIYESPLLEQLPTDIAGIYTLGGSRQVGKTTLLKQWMVKLLNKGVLPQAIAFFSGELIDDLHALLRLIQNQLLEMPRDTMRYLLIDEVTYIKDWDKAVKFAADAGLLEQVELVLTSSDLIIIQEARMRFPGRRGWANKVDFHLYPLSFNEVVKIKKVNQDSIDDLFAEFNNYLKHGGYMTAINNLAAHNYISIATLNTYSDWVRGDMLKRGKQEHYLREILSAIIKRYNSQLTWNALARDLSIDHHQTIADYVAMLVSMDTLFVQHALLEDKLTAAAKKARKIVFTDPFIFHAIRSWLQPVENPYQTQICSAIDDPELSSQLVEACVTTHFRRFYPTYYIKADGEVDIAYVDKDRFWPIEIKWTNQVRAKDFKQVIKYPNSCILTKSKQSSINHNIKTEPLPVALLKLDKI